jgi:Zn-dependent protease with chaperone function
VIAPLLLGGVLVVAHVIDLVEPLGAAEWAALHDAVFVGPTLYRKLLGHETAISWRALAVLYMAPGAILMLMTWPFVQLLSRSAGVGSLLRRLDARPPDPRRLAEQQMVNVVGEMAVAAGVRAPSVGVIDSHAVNAVAVGLTTNDATILVTNGFLERLDRDERQATVAHLIGSVGNGDLEIAATIFSVFETWALVAALLETPLSARRRAFVRQFVRLAYQATRGRADEREARAMVDALLIGSGQDVDDFISMVESVHPSSFGNGCYIILVQIPLIASVGLGMIAARESTNLFTLLVLSPWLGAMWRARRYLADATAVQLTRNPDALASAVRTLSESDVEVPGGWPVHFLFPVWVRTPDTPDASFAGASIHAPRMRVEPEPRLRRLAALGALSGDHTRVRLAQRMRSVVAEWRDARNLVGWIILASALIAVLMLVTMLCASLLLMVLWYMLRWSALPVRFLRGSRS